MKNKSLFDSLQSLYSRLFNTILRIRMLSYRPTVKSNNSLDITTLLNNQVDELAASSVINTTVPTDFGEKHLNSESASIKQDNYFLDRKNEFVTNLEFESEFSKYLKQKKSSSIIHPHMGGQLKKSTWEHVHKAIRYARQADVTMAKLHADIAGHALEEAEHYLKDEEYSELVFEIEECFIKSKKEKEQEV